jgi:hypothetical protein
MHLPTIDLSVLILIAALALAARFYGWGGGTRPGDPF